MSKNFKEFSYTKDGVTTRRQVVILNQDSDHLTGIDLGKLSDTEKAEFMKAVDAMQEATSKVMKAFRNFKKSCITD